MPEICKICGQKTANKTHLKEIHNLTPEEYEAMDASTFEETEDKLPIEAAEPVSTTQSKRVDSIFDGTIIKSVSTQPLNEFLGEFGLSEIELRNIVKQYKEDGGIPVSQQLKNKQDRADLSAETLKDEDKVQTTDLFTADILSKKYNFKVTEVRSKGPSGKKTWYLEKI